MIATQVMWWVTLPAVLASVVAPVLAFTLARRKFGGGIKTSEAEDLWEESRSIRGDYQARLALADARIVRLEERIDSLVAENVKLREQIRDQ